MRDIDEMMAEPEINKVHANQDKETKENSGMEMKRELGFFSASNFIVASIIGSGIFVSPSSALQYSGSIGLCLIIWVAAGVISLLGALAFAELGNVIPKSGGEYVFFIESFGPKHKFWGPLPAFMFAFISVLVLKPSGMAVLLLTSSEYVAQLVLEFVCLDETSVFWLKRAIALLELWLITFINVTSVKLYVTLQNVFSVMKMFVCVIIIGCGAYAICTGNIVSLHNGFEGTRWNVGNIALALVSGLWAYDGWDSLTSATEEIKKPEKNLLRSILCSISLVIAFYLCVNISYMAVLTVPEMTSGQAVALAFGDKMLGSFTFLIPLGVTVSTFGCAMTSQFAITRICYVASQYGHMPKSLSFIHIDKLTPSPAVLLQGILATVVILMGDIVQLIEFATFLLWIAYGLSMVSLLVFRRTLPNAKRSIKVPVALPLFMIVVAIFLCIASIAFNPSLKYFIAVGVLLVAFIVYYFFVYRTCSSRFLDRFTRFIQVFLKVAPSDSKILQ